MIEQLHYLADVILGCRKNYTYSNTYRFIIINTTGYKVNLKDDEGNIVRPIKEGRRGNIEWSLEPGLYYVRCYEIVDKEIRDRYYEEIYVSSEMLGRARTFKI